MKNLVSVIVPVYNVEAYIEKCVQSLLDQTYTNFEALIVDDGSPDNSILLARQKVGNDPRFRFFEKENGGQGTARNLALDNAKGEYIAFLDSDDYFDINFLSIMIDKITNTGADVCTCDVSYVDEKGIELRVHRNDIESYLNKKDYLMSHWYISNFMWDKLFKAECFNGFRFDPKVKTYEDVHLLFRLIYKKKLTSVERVLYNYVQRIGSTMRSLPVTYISDRYSIYQEANNFYESNLKSIGVKEDVIIRYYLYNYLFLALTNISKYSNDFVKQSRRLLNVDNKNIFTFKNIVLNKYLSRKIKCHLLIFKVSPKLYKTLKNIKNNTTS